MASENKKRKGKNSFIEHLGHKTDNWKCKRLAFFTKQNRAKNRRICKDADSN